MIKVENFYPITTVTFPGGRVQEFITYQHLKEYTRPVDMDNFDEFMAGQTRYPEGFYVGDVRKWLSQLPSPN